MCVGGKTITPQKAGPTTLTKFGFASWDLDRRTHPKDLMGDVGVKRACTDA